MFTNFTEEARRIMDVAKEITALLKHPFVGSEHLLLALLKEENNVSRKLRKKGLTYERAFHKIKDYIGVGDKVTKTPLYTPVLRRILENAVFDGKDNKSDVTPDILFMSFLEEGDAVGMRILLSFDLNLEELYRDFSEPPKKKAIKKSAFQEIGIDMTEEKHDPIVGREKEVNEVIQILLRKNKNNPLLIGPAGVGKTAIVEELASLIKKGAVPFKLRNKKIISVDMGSMIAGTKYRGEFEERIKKIINECLESENIILFIDEIHTLMGAGGAEGAIDASNILKPYLARGKLSIIGATTTEEYEKTIANDKALARRFQNILIKEPCQDTVVEILKALRPIYSKYHHVLIDDEHIDKIVKLTARCVRNRNQPDAAIDLLDETCALVSLKPNELQIKFEMIKKTIIDSIEVKNKLLRNNDINKALALKNQINKMQVEMNEIEQKLTTEENYNKMTNKAIINTLSAKTNIPIYELNNTYDVKSLKDSINKALIGQSKAKEELLADLLKIRLGLNNDSCTSFLFLGPSGVGKTELARRAGEAFLGRDNVIKLDMSEFREPTSINKIIGSPPGYSGYLEKNSICDQIKYKPHAVLILDEIDKACLEVQNLFFQILEDSKIKTNNNEEIYFNHIIIIMTSNAGFENISLGFMPNKNHETAQYFDKSFLNRIHKVINFEPLKEVEIKELAKIKYKEITEKYQTKGIKTTKIDLNEVVTNSNFKDYGGRQIEKMIKDKIDQIIINNILEEKYVNN